MFTKTERRQQPRIYYKPDKPLKARVRIVHLGDAPVSVNIINISEAGLCFHFDPKSSLMLKTGVHLILLKIENEPLLRNITDVDMVLQWSTYIKALNCDLNGCCFLNMIPEQHKQLHDFIHQTLAAIDEAAP